MTNLKPISMIVGTSSVSVPIMYVIGVVHLVAVVYITDKINIDQAGAAEIMTDAKNNSPAKVV